jgi:hypothetical protein
LEFQIRVYETGVVKMLGMDDVRGSRGLAGRVIVDPQGVLICE